jgi:peptide/nickel transport system permease protein
LNLPELLSGEVITSIVLNLPTAGPLLFEALLQEDIYMSASILQFYGVVLLIGNLLADIGLAWLDPRIRYD